MINELRVLSLWLTSVIIVMIQFGNQRWLLQVCSEVCNDDDDVVKND
jgi:hypothetical protein